MILTLLLTFLTTFLLSITYFLRTRSHKYQKMYVQVRQNRQVSLELLSKAPGPFPWPIIGDLHLLGKHDVPFKAFTELADQYGDIYSLTLGTTPCLVVNNVELIREVLNQNGRFFGGRPDFIRFHKLFGGDRNNSLALCDWSNLQQKRRNLARKHCSPRESSAYFTKMSEVSGFEMNEFLEQITLLNVDGVEFDLKPLIMASCFNMFSQYMCSLRFSYDDQEFRKTVRRFDEIFWEINQGYAVDFLPWLLPFYRKHMQTLESWSTHIRTFILSRIINEREQNIDVDEPENDFTDALLKSLKEDASVTRETIIYMLEDFLGGHSAIGNLVMLALAFVVKNPAVGAAIQEEIDTVKSSRSITLSDTDLLPYTMSTISETLRYSSSPIVPHVATENAQIAGYAVEKGTIVFINNYGLNTSEKYWTNPEEFNPERFLERSVIEAESEVMSSENASDSGVESENEVTKSEVKSAGFKKVTKVKKNIAHFLPFSVGKRTCIGQTLVRGFSFVMFATILQKFDVSSDNVGSIRTYPACVAVPPDTFHLKLTARKRN